MSTAMALEALSLVPTCTVNDIAALARQAKESGIALDSGPGPLPWGPTGFSVTDPDGFKLTIADPS